MEQASVVYSGQKNAQRFLPTTPHGVPACVRVFSSSLGCFLFPSVGLFFLPGLFSRLAQAQSLFHRARESFDRNLAPLLPSVFVWVLFFVNVFRFH